MSTKLGGRYQLVREIGTGGMGRVFQAVDTETGRSVAAKIMLASGDDNLDALLRFYQEGAVLSTLKHPNIVEVYGTFLEEQTCCIIMELLEGQSLRQLLTAERLSLPRAKHLVGQVAAALAYAHSRGIVHRDIKPDNIMVVGNDQVKVTDFGIARILRGGATLNTMTGMSIGTPLYMAPEQIEGQKVDGRADLYSLGSVLYQMVTGQPPFTGEDPLTVAFKHVHKAPAPPRTINADLPPDWEALILKMLAKDPADRFQTAAALQEAITGLDAGARQVIPVQPPPSRRRDTVDEIIHPEMRPTEPQPPASGPKAAERPAPEPGPPGPPTSPWLPPTHPPSPSLAADPNGRAAVAVEDRPATEEESRRGGGVPFLAVGAGIVLLLVVAGAAYLLFHRSPSQPPAVALLSPGCAAARGCVSGQQVTLRWKKVPKAAVYQVQVATAPGDPSDAVLFRHPRMAALTENSFYSLSVIGAQTYYWRVRANVDTRWTSFSPSRHFVVGQPRIGQPAPLAPPRGASLVGGHVRLCWSRPAHAVGYRLRVSSLGTQNVAGNCRYLVLQVGPYTWSVAAQVRGIRTYVGPFSRLRRFTIRPRPTPTPKPTPRPKPTAAPQPPTPTPQPVRAVLTPTPQPVRILPTPTPQPYVPPPTAVPQATASTGKTCTGTLEFGC